MAHYKVSNCLYEGLVFHERTLPKKHKFKYSVFYINIDICKIENIISKLYFFSYNKSNLFSFYTKDHGPKGCKDLKSWVIKSLRKTGINKKIKDIYLLTYPRIFGYVFNPLSIYTCIGINGEIVGQIYEVHNTFKQRFFYIVKNTYDKKNHAHKVKKSFHVSPFMSMKGSYNFKSFQTKSNLNININYNSKHEKFIASFVGTKKKLSNKQLIKNFFKLPFMTLKIIIGIHFEATILYFKGLKYIKCPQPKKPNHLKSYRK